MRSYSILAVLAGIAVPLTAQTDVVQRKLSGPMVSGVVGDVGELLISPTGDRVLYQVLHGAHVASIAGPAELVSAPVDGGEPPVVLSSLDAGNVVSLRWTPDGLRALYVVLGSGHELYSALADGSAPPALLFVPSGFPTLRSDPSFLDTVQPTADGARVLYLAGSKLYSVPVDGIAPPVQLNGPLPIGGFVWSFRASPSGSEVVYAAEQDSNNLVELYYVPADGSAAPIKISHPLAGEDDVLDGYTIDPTGTRAVYRTSSGGAKHVFSVPLDGSEMAVQLSPSLSVGGVVESFLVSPDGTAVVCRANPNAGLQYELFLSPIDGSAAPVSLAPVPSGATVYSGYQFSLDSAYVVGRARTGGLANPAVVLCSVRVSDGHVQLLRATDVTSFQVTPDSSRVVFLYGNELYSRPIDGSSPALRISPDFVPGGRLDVSAYDDGGYAITPDSLGVVYRADADTVGALELYRVATVPAGAPVATKLDPALVSGGQAGRFRIAPDSASVVYAADAYADDVWELLRSDLAGPPDASVLSGQMPSRAVGDVRQFLARGGRAVYAADQETDDQVELFSAPSDGNAAPVKLSGTLVSGGDVVVGDSSADFTLSPDATSVVYRADAVVDERFELYSVPSDGSAAPIRLNGALSANTDVGPFRVSADGTRVVYRASESVAPGQRLHTVPIHGGVPVPLALSSMSFEITPDSTHVLFVNGSLYAVPIDGSAVPVDLSGPGSVEAFEASADSTRVAFRIALSGTRRLFASSILGGIPVDLSGSLVAGGEVMEFAISPNGERVVYRADAAVDQRSELYSVPIDGSAAPILLNGPLPGGGDVQQFELTPDGGSVVYNADQELNNLGRLHRVPIDGSAPDVLLSMFDLDFAEFHLTPDGAFALYSISNSGLRVQPIAGGPPILIASGDVVSHVVSENSRRVYYLREGRVSVESITGGPSVELNPGTTAFFDEVASLALDGERVLYRAEDAPGVAELFASWLSGAVQHEPPSGMRSVTR